MKKPMLQDGERWTDALIGVTVALAAGLVLILIIVAVVANFS